MTKVFILNHGLANGGTDTFCLNILKHINWEKFDVRMILAVDPDSRPQFREEEVRQLGIPIDKTSDLDGIKKMLRHAVRLYKLLQKEKPDVFHANMDLFNGVNMFVARLAGVPVRVCHSHNSESQYEANSGKHIAVSIYRGIMRWLLWHFSTARCGCSELAMDYLYGNKWRTDASACVIHNGIDLTAFSEINTSDAKERLGLRSGIHYLITVGRLAEQKNPLFLVDVMKAVCNRWEDVELLWVGTGEMEQQVRSKIAEENLEQKIHLLGARKDVPQILRCGEAFVFPSLFEGLPIALIEAQGAGLPCLVSDRITQEADMGGCVFLSIDEGTALWAETIVGVLDGTIVKNVCPEKMREYDVGYMIEQLEQIYQR